jgi:ketosteroid isomerase-like protein
MADHQNVVAVREAWDALAEGNPAPLYELTAPDAVLHMCPGQSWLSGSHQGRDTAFGLLMQSGQATRDSMKLVTHDVVGNDEHVVALLNFSFERDGRTLEGNESWVSHLRDGKITETWVFIWDQEDAEGFWSAARPD